MRSIGSCIDGLKVSQRKILFSCLKRKLYKEIRVAQLSGYVSEQAAYHHGEASLQGAIVGMAQNFVGQIILIYSNRTVNLEHRIMGGNDFSKCKVYSYSVEPDSRYYFPTSRSSSSRIH